MREAVEIALEEAGLRYRIAGAGLIEEMARSLQQLRSRGILPSRILEEYADSLACAVPEGMAEARSLVVVAAPSPPLRVVFDLGDREIEALVPPTYVSTETRASTLALLRRILGPHGFSVERIAVPAKLLATRVGLTVYGRNGVAYVEDLGSFVRLDVYVTDADLSEEDEGLGAVVADDLPDSLPVPPRLRKCLSCAWCYHACPTGCIGVTGDRIDPLGCLTYLNEHEGPFPAGLQLESHNSLVGCMVCQQGCRANEGLIPPSRLAATFDREETEIILKDLPEDELPDGVRKKLESIDLAGYSTVLGRNLRALAARDREQAETFQTRGGVAAGCKKSEDHGRGKDIA